MTWLKCINKITEWVAVLATLVMTISVLLLVFFRYVLNLPINWAQELSVFAMMVAAMGGVACTFYARKHVAVGAAVELFPAPVQAVLNIIARVITILFLGVVTYQGILLAMAAMAQISPTVGIPIGYIMLSVPIGAALSILYLLRDLVSRADLEEDPQETVIID